jgi:hypothetical protein
MEGAVTLGELIAADECVALHCRACGHYATIPATDLPRHWRPVPVPLLEGKFRCTRCNSSDTCAMPIYRTMQRPAPAKGKGWIMPPGE